MAAETRDMTMSLIESSVTGGIGTLNNPVEFQ